MRKKIILVFLAALVVLLNVLMLTHKSPSAPAVSLELELTGDTTDELQLFYGPTTAFSADHQVRAAYKTAGEKASLTFALPADASYLRLDFGTGGGSFTIHSMRVTSGKTVTALDAASVLPGGALFEESQDIESTEETGEGITLATSEGDPYVVFAFDAGEAGQAALASQKTRNTAKNCFYTLLLDAAVLLLFILRKHFATLPIELWQNRSLILQLARNDFKTKYAGSVFGIFWAFVQPVVTILVYWFVFQVGLRSSAVANANGVTYPFVLWLMCGLVPWFFFQDTLVGGTNALTEYTYLVKKVVFKISILPIVKEISALFVHLFFIFIMILVFTLMGHFPDLYVLQVLYYSLCLFLYSLGVCYATCAIVVFFRDLTQIINIILQVQVWLTPIMWNIDDMQRSGRMPGWLIAIFKLNPLYYIVNGYRDSMMNKVWFFEHFDLTVYFWVVTAAFFAVGTVIFKRLKVHFADVL